MGDAPDQIFVLAIGDIVDQHALYVRFSIKLFQCQNI